MMSALDALGDGHTQAYDWFLEAEQIWDRQRKDKTRTFQGRLNYNSTLTDQQSRVPYVVLYNAAGTNLCAAMLTAGERKRAAGVPISGFVAYHKTWRYYAGTEQEAHYLLGVLNSGIVNEMIKPFQTQGLLGERDIERRPFEVCAIPLFEATSPLHTAIAELARQCREELLPVVRKMQTPVATARGDARDLVRGKLDKLDALVGQMLGQSAVCYPAHTGGSAMLLELF
jgi:hypothetical protein